MKLRVCILLICSMNCAVVTQLLSAQSAQPAPDVFTATSDLVLVPVVVRQGMQSACCLTKSDFTIVEDKVPQRIAFVKEASGPTETRKPATTNKFTNQPQNSTELQQLTLIVLDTINTPIVDQTAIAHALTQFLSASSKLEQPTAIVALTPAGLQLVHDFTGNGAALSAALDRSSGGKDANGNKSREELGKSPPVLGVASWVEPHAVQERSWVVQRLGRTLEGLTILSQSMYGIQGRKTLIWFTGAFPLAFDEPSTYLSRTPDLKPNQMARPKPGKETNVYDAQIAPEELPSSDQDLRILRPTYKRLMQQLADANVAVYPVDSRGMVARFPNGDEHVRLDTLVAGRGIDLHTPEAEQDAMLRVYMGRFAEATGGRPCNSTNDLTSCLNEAVSDSQRYYLLGYYRDKRNNTPGWRSLKVTVNRSGTQVLARTGYFYLNDVPNSDEARRRDISDALMSPVGFSGIIFTADVNPLPKPDKQVRDLVFTLQLPPDALDNQASSDNRVSLEIVTTATAADGKLLDKVSKTVAGAMTSKTGETIRKNGVSYQATLHVPTGECTLHFVVRNNFTGRTGSIVVPYTVN